MSQQLISNWLGLPASTAWPPDHYTLLGLEPGESDISRIEQSVHERMGRVRRYQLTHPEVATEAMTRLAQAMCCLTDACSRRTYTKAQFPNLVLHEPIEVLQATVASPAPAATAVLREKPSYVQEPPPIRASQAQMDWAVAPPPPRARSEHDTVIDSLDATTDTDVVPTLPAVSVPVVPMPAAAAAEPVDHIEEAARLTGAARRNLTTKRAMYYRIARTRQLQHAWEQVGRFLGDPQFQLSRPTEYNALTTQLSRVRELLRSFPPILGEAGRPGAYVMALARQQLIVPTFMGLNNDQRTRLAEDWQAGQRLLQLHRQFLREELRKYRHRNAVKHGFKCAGSFVLNSPFSILILLATVALNVTYPILVEKHWAEQIVVLLGLACLKAYLCWDELQQTKPLEPLPPEKKSAPRAQRQPKGAF